MPRFAIRRRFPAPGFGALPGSTTAPPQPASGQGAGALQGDTFVPFRSDAGLARAADELGFKPWAPQTGIEENQGNPYLDEPGIAEQLQRPLDPGIDTPGYVNPYRTIMYAVQTLSSSVPTRVLVGNPKRTYLLIQNQGPGNLYVGIGVDPVAGGLNVMTLVSTQIYEQVGGGFFLPPGVLAGLPQGLSIPSSFSSPEYISLLTDATGATAMILEGSFLPLQFKHVA